MENNIYFVQKREDIERYTTPWYIKVFGWSARRIAKGREDDGRRPINDYYIVNLNDSDGPFVSEFGLLLRKHGRG
jgi:hypothetical protein